ncbi:MAG: hypothetical protein ACJA0N_002051 [Pseudohongiellaceae bacterium]|jgi:hypothetical protein
MSLGSWSPDSEQQNKTFAITEDLLQKFLSFAEASQIENIGNSLDDKEQQKLAPIMTLPSECWDEATARLADQDIEKLMQVFTQAEQLPGWEAGNQSPVIWLGKILKKRGTRISKELTLWIKNNSNNRFLPHGSLL